MKLALFVVRRLALGVATLVLVATLVFWATELLPGDAATSILGEQATPQMLKQLRATLHLDEPASTRYLHWLTGAMHGDFGTSLASQQSVGSLLSGRIENSAFLVVVSALFAIPLAFTFGAWSAIRRDRPADHVISMISLVLTAVPEFVIGIVVILVFSTGLFHLFPAVSTIPPGQGAWSHLKLVVLPALTLVLAVMPYIARMMRVSLVEVMQSEYVEMARLKGLKGRAVIISHAIPNALVPAVQVSALQLAWMAGGIVLVEYVFAFPGIGTSLVDAVGNRDIPVVQAITLLIAGVYVVVNVVADVVSILLTPKARTSIGDT